MVEIILGMTQNDFCNDDWSLCKMPNENDRVTLVIAQQAGKFKMEEKPNILGSIGKKSPRPIFLIGRAL